MRYALFGLWLLTPLGLYVGHALYGPPYMVVAYTFRDNGHRYDPYRERFYLTCTYRGWLSARTVPATQGRCTWIRFFPEGGNA